MTIPLAIKIADVVPLNTWITNEDIRLRIENKYGPVELHRVQSVMSNMQRSRYVKIEKKRLYRGRCLYMFTELDFHYIKLALGSSRPEGLPEWVTENLKPAVTYPAGFLMAEFNNLISRARHV